MDPENAAVDHIPPQCDNEGFYAPKQCGSFGLCWCALPNGTTVEGTQTFSNTPLSNCSDIVRKVLGQGKKLRHFFVNL